MAAGALTEKFGWEAEQAEEAVGQVVRLAEVVVPREALSEIEADLADNRVLEAAAEGRAGAIVSGDRHLLALGSWRGIEIQSPAAFISETGMP